MAGTDQLDPFTGDTPEPMSAVLTEHEHKDQPPSTYDEWIRKAPSKQQLREEVVTVSIK